MIDDIFKRIKRLIFVEFDYKGWNVVVCYNRCFGLVWGNFYGVCYRFDCFFLIFVVILSDFFWWIYDEYNIYFS